MPRTPKDGKKPARRTPKKTPLANRPKIVLDNYNPLLRRNALFGDPFKYLRPYMHSFISTHGYEELEERPGQPQRYFYLIVRGPTDGNALTRDDVQSFFRSGANTGSDFIFVFVDIASDDRLQKVLSAKKGGDVFYERIESKAPLFLITDRAIKNVENLHTVKLTRITNYEKDVAVLFKEMGFEDADTRKSAIRFLKRVNRYIKAEPTIFGFGIKFNEIISDLLIRMENKSP